MSPWHALCGAWEMTWNDPRLVEEASDILLRFPGCLSIMHGAEAKPSTSCRSTTGVQMAVLGRIERPTESMINTLQMQLSSWHFNTLKTSSEWMHCVSPFGTAVRCASMNILERRWTGKADTGATSNPNVIDGESDVFYAVTLLWRTHLSWWRRLQIKPKWFEWSHRFIKVP